MRGNKLFKFIDAYFGKSLLFICGRLFRQKIQLASMRYQPDRILLIKLSAMGDTILMIPAIRNLRQAYPKAIIKMIVTKVNREVLADCPYLDGLILLDLEELVKKPWLSWNFIKLLRKEYFDLAIDFDQWLRISPLLAFLSGAEQRVGFKTLSQHRDQTYTKRVVHDPDKHEVECFLDLLRVLEVPITDKDPELWVQKSITTKINKKLADHGAEKGETMIGLHPGCGSHGFPRQWPEQSYVELIKRLQEEHQGMIVLTGGSQEEGLVNRIAAKLEVKPILAVGWDLAETIALVKKLKVLVCGNTGVMHIAAAVKTPVVALHGPTDPRKWGPWGGKHIILTAKSSCSPCLYLGFEYACHDYPCMATITVDEVYGAISNYLK
ncbi:MAG: glycosyltransferase family 9 protein [bacterium]|nr:glycosyltransferase family 9 protein [bacterium]MDD5354470.1 glycosyltransferase family 9 protein [bacterium]MDD5755695.1 glycosyltransferase family 9 protein [bacterium]